MTVKTLIKELQTFDPNLVVMTDGYEGGVDLSNPPKLIHVKRDEDHGDAWWNGRYDQVDKDTSGSKPVCYLSR